MVSVIPVTKPFFIRNSTASATSSGRPGRPTGNRFEYSVIKALRRSPSVSRKGVSIRPGWIALTLIGARSTASARAKASTAAHEAVATDAPRIGRIAAAPDMNVIEPPALILVAADLAALKA